MREIAFSMNHLQEQIKNDIEFNAKIHNQKVKFPEVDTTEVRKELNEKQLRQIEHDKNKFFGDK